MTRLVLFVLVALLVRDAHAADAKAQTAALKTMVSALSKMEDDLSNADKSDGSARLTRVRRTHLPAVEKGLEAYEKASDGDSTGEKNVATWKKLLGQLEKSVEKLAAMRVLMTVQDNGPTRCKAAWTALDEEITDLKKRLGPDDAIKAIKKEVVKLAAPIAAGMKDFDKKLAQLKDLGDDASRPSTSDKMFSHIYNEVDSAADAIVGHYVHANAAIHDACDRLAKGMDNPDVEDVIEELGRTGSRIGKETVDAKADYERWVRRVQDLGKWHEGAEDELRRAICGADDQDGVILHAAIDQAADRLKDKFSSEWTLLNKAATALHPRLTKAGLDKEAKLLEDRVRRIENAVKNGILRGANEPKLRAQMEIGKKEHDSYQRSCSAKEVVLSSKDRVDCVKYGSPCEVIEIKPDTPSGSDAGDRQIKRYQNTLEDTWSSNPAKFDSGDLEIFKDHCVDKGKLNLEYKVHLYKFCPDKWDIADVRVFGD